jgi:hypothetical protein
MKKSILIGSLIACFLMLMIPNISAVEYTTFKNSGPDYDEEELIQAIIERIEELQEKNPNMKFYPNFDDPDGPFEGGLDDFLDWYFLFAGIVYSTILAYMLKELPLIEIIKSGEILTIALAILDYGICTSATIVLLGEAFDIGFDLLEDGR